MNFKQKFRKNKNKYKVIYNKIKMNKEKLRR